MKKELDKNFLKKIKEFDDHFFVVHIKNNKTKLNCFIAIHRKKNNMPSFGATRFWKYKNNKEALFDVLRLSKLMSYKSALSDIPCGGAKAVIVEPRSKYDRKKLLKSYAMELNKLNGDFITGTDVGLNKDDLDYMKKFTDYLVGYTNNPEKYTAIGVFNSINIAIKHQFPDKKIKDLSFHIQGIGKVGYELLNNLLSVGVKKVYISDIEKHKVDNILNNFNFIKKIEIKEKLKENIDIFCPCAMSGVINKKNVDNINYKIIVGCANNQLHDINLSKKLHKNNVLYCPDYIVNSGGLISVVDEYLYKKRSKNRLNNSISKIHLILEKIIIESKENNIAPVLLSEKIGKILIKGK